MDGLGEEERIWIPSEAGLQMKASKETGTPPYKNKSEICQPTEKLGSPLEATERNNLPTPGVGSGEVFIGF